MSTVTSDGLIFMQSLSAEKKAELFDKISENYYNANFGSFSKSQSDLLMFSIYLEALLDDSQSFDDYTISKQLGILQTNVRQLKKKKQLIYPRNYQWYEAFLAYSETAIFDHTGRIAINIQDPNVYIELQHAIEEIGGFVEVQLNSKLLKIPPGYFLELLLKIYQEESKCDDKAAKKFKTEFMKEMNQRYLAEKELENKLSDKTVLSKLKDEGMQIGLEILKDMIPGGTIVAKGIRGVMKALFE